MCGYGRQVTSSRQDRHLQPFHLHYYHIELLRSIQCVIQFHFRRDFRQVFCVLGDYDPLEFYAFSR